VKVCRGSLRRLVAPDKSFPPNACGISLSLTPSFVVCIVHRSLQVARLNSCRILYPTVRCLIDEIAIQSHLGQWNIVLKSYLH
jgi:hypothetical protein